MSGDDIVDRLRQSNGFKVHHTDDGPAITADVELLSEAADKIERLRSAGDAMFKVMTTRFADDDDWYAAIAAWQEARRG